VLEDVILIKIGISLLDVIKQVLAYATLLKEFCTQIEKSLTCFNILECSIVPLHGPRMKTV